MGTRNITIVKLNGEIKVRQYCQWDGNPTGVGAKIAEFIHNDLDIKKLTATLTKVKFISEAEADQKLESKAKEIQTDEHIVRKQLGMEHGDVYERALKKLPELNRDTGPAILKLIQDGKVHNLLDAGAFDQNSWCEYAYELDLDEKTITVFWAGPSKTFSKKYPFKKFTPQEMPKLEQHFSKERASLTA